MASILSSSPCAPRRAFQPDDVLSSSPPAPAPTATRKQKRPPPITPKRFTRFFTPRNTRSSRSSQSSSARQLQDITRAALNRSHARHRTTPRKTVNFADVENQMHTPQSSARKRRNPYLSPESSPAQLQSSPSKRPRYVTPEPLEVLDDSHDIEDIPVYAAPIRRLKTLGGSSRRLQRSFGGILSVGRGFRRDHCTSWQDQTANFYSNADDVHSLSQNAPPFCTASCNSKLIDSCIHAMVLTWNSKLAACDWRRRRVHSPRRF
jgi:hypothetical protein